MKNIIVAYDKQRAIGKDGRLPWEGQMPADMRHFRETTMGSALIMGRLTFESIGRPLPGRDNIVVSCTLDVIEGIKVARDLEEAFELASQREETFVIGGESLYRQSIDNSDRIYATEVDADIGGDRYFPELNLGNWQSVSTESHLPDGQNAYGYSFVVYDAIKHL